MKLREYQCEAISSIFSYYENGNNGNIIAALPTGTGKSFILAGFIYEAFKRWPNQRFILLSHVKKILEQDYKAIKTMWENAPVGVYSAGLNQRDIAFPIIIGGVASVVNNIDLFGHRDICIVDECHLISPSEDTMYQTIIKRLLEINPSMKVIGTSATPYRLSQGLLTEKSVFHDFCIDLSKKLELPTRMVFRLVYKESDFIDTIVSPRGAYGFMQIMPSTDKLYNNALQVDTLKLDDNEKNIYIGMHILKDMYDYWISKGKPDSYSRKLSLACYNAGIGTVLYYNGIPPYEETIGYIRFILKEHSITTDLSTNNYLTNR